MERRIFDESVYFANRKKIFRFIGSLFVSSIIFALIIFLLYLICGRNNYIVISFFLAISATIFLALILFMVNYKIIPIKNYNQLILDGLNCENIIQMNVKVENIDKLTYSINRMIFHRYKVKDIDTNKSIYIYINLSCTPQIECDKIYTIKLYDNYLISFDDNI